MLARRPVSGGRRQQPDQAFDPVREQRKQRKPQKVNKQTKAGNRKLKNGVGKTMENRVSTIINATPTVFLIGHSFRNEHREAYYTLSAEHLSRVSILRRARDQYPAGATHTRTFTHSHTRRGDSAVVPDASLLDWPNEIQCDCTHRQDTAVRSSRSQGNRVRTPQRKQPVNLFISNSTTQSFQPFTVHQSILPSCRAPRDQTKSNERKQIKAALLRAV